MNRTKFKISVVIAFLLMVSEILISQNATNQPFQNNSNSSEVIVNNDDGLPYYVELIGEWRTSQAVFIFPDGRPNPTSRYTIRSMNPGARCEFRPQISLAGKYNIYCGVPMTSACSDHTLAEIKNGEGSIDSVWFDQNTSEQSDWKYLGSYFLTEGSNNSVALVNDVSGAGYVIRADVMMFEKVPEDADIKLIATEYDFGEVFLNTTQTWELLIMNLGESDLEIQDMKTQTPYFSIDFPDQFPVSLSANDTLISIIEFRPNFEHFYEDTLTIYSNDPDEPQLTLSLRGLGTTYSVILDFNDPEIYSESPTSTTWQPLFSDDSLRIVGRYTNKYLHPNAWANWKFKVDMSSTYRIYMLSIDRENFTDYSPYVTLARGGILDTVVIDQSDPLTNMKWIYLGNYHFSEDTSYHIKLYNDTTITYQDDKPFLATNLIRLTQVPEIPDIEIQQSCYDFDRVPIHTFKDWKFNIYNIGNKILNITHMNTQTNSFAIIQPNIFPIKILPCDSITAIVRFQPDEFKNYVNTLTIFCDDFDEQELNISLKGSGCGVGSIIDDSDTDYYCDGPNDTTWHTVENYLAVNGTIRVANRKRHPDAWARWTIKVDASADYNFLISVVTLDSISQIGPYVAEIEGVRPDTIFFCHHLSAGTQTWCYLNNYYLQQGTENYIWLINDPTFGEPDKNSMLVADAIMLTKITEVKDDDVIVWDYKLFQNYPNPFNMKTTLPFEIPKRSEVTISLYNIKGQLVERLFKGIKSPGYHLISWNAIDKPSGIYFIKFQAGEVTQVKKCLLLK